MEEIEGYFVIKTKDGYAMIAAKKGTMLENPSEDEAKYWTSWKTGLSEDGVVYHIKELPEVEYDI